MKIINSLILAVAIVLLAACSNSETSKPSDLTGPEADAVEAAQDFIRIAFAPDAVFQSAGTIVEPTSVPDRYKVLQRFDSEDQDGYNFVYRIWVQKFTTGWEYGNLAIERAGGENVLNTNGRMKEVERQNMTRQETSSSGDIEFTIIKRSAPNYVRVYTPNRLKRDDVLAVYNQLKNEYEIVQFSTSSNPDDDDYMAIQYGSVYEYDKDKITKLADY